MPTVSAILPTYNRADSFTRAVNSILAQTFTDFELILIDDASTDNTQEMASQLDDSRIKYIRHDINKGGSAARNSGLKMASGKYIAFLDDDDLWIEKKLEIQVKKFEEVKDNVGLIYSGAEVFEPDGKTVYRTHIPYIKGDVKNLLLLGSLLCGIHTVLIKKECFEKVGFFDESLKSCQDWDMWKRIADYYEFDYVPDVLAKTFLHNKQISSNFACLIPGRTRMIEKHLNEFKKHPKILITHYKKLGKLNCLNGTWSKGFHWFKEAIKINFIEVFKILIWCVIELPINKYFSRTSLYKKFK